MNDSSATDDEQDDDLEAEIQQLVEERSERWDANQKRFVRLLQGLFKKYRDLNYVDWYQYSFFQGEGPCGVKKFSFSYQETLLRGSQNSLVAVQSQDPDIDTDNLPSKLDNLFSLIWNTLELHNDALYGMFGDHQYVKATLKKGKVSF